MGRVKPGQGCPGSFGFPIPEVSKEFITGQGGGCSQLGPLGGLGGLFQPHWL